MTTETYANPFLNWAKERLDEIDATLTSIEARAGSLQAGTKKHAENALSEIRAQRDVFKEAIQKKKADSEAGWASAKSELEANWTAFEAYVQKYLSETRQDAAQLQATFEARAEAQQKAWQETFDALIGKASTFASAKKQDADAALAHLKTEADAVKSKLETHRKAGEQSWSAFKTALEDSRAAFEQASRKALEAFKKVA
ncbi:MAG: hypothetical protein WAN43_12050 [Rhodomicrobium sp.]|jgi:hypothetical protein